MEKVAWFDRMFTEAEVEQGKIAEFLNEVETKPETEFIGELQITNIGKRVYVLISAFPLDPRPSPPPPHGREQVFCFAAPVGARGGDAE